MIIRLYQRCLETAVVTIFISKPFSSGTLNCLKCEGVKAVSSLTSLKEEPVPRQRLAWKLSKSADICICMNRFVCSITIFFYKDNNNNNNNNNVYASNLSFLRCSHVDSLFYQWWNENGWRLACVILLPHTPALFIYRIICLCTDYYKNLAGYSFRWKVTCLYLGRWVWKETYGQREEKGGGTRREPGKEEWPETIQRRCIDV